MTGAFSLFDVVSESIVTQETNNETDHEERSVRVHVDRADLRGQAPIGSESGVASATLLGRNVGVVQFRQTSALAYLSSNDGNVPDGRTESITVKFESSIPVAVVVRFK